MGGGDFVFVGDLNHGFLLVDTLDLKVGVDVQAQPGKGEVGEGGEEESAELLQDFGVVGGGEGLFFEGAAEVLVDVGDVYEEAALGIAGALEGDPKSKG
jgi:hypothetical protein